MDTIHAEYREGLVTQIIFISLGRCPQGQHQCYILGKALEPLRGMFLGKWKEFGALSNLRNQTSLFQYALIVNQSPKQNLVNLIGHALESFLMNQDQDSKTSKKHCKILPPQKYIWVVWWTVSSFLKLASQYIF